MPNKKRKKAKKKKSAKTPPRNPYVLPARQRKAGVMKNKKDKRSKENKSIDYTNEKNQ